MKPIRVVRGHGAKCIFRDPTVQRPECWYFPIDVDFSVERRGWRRYVYAICNDPYCKGRVRVAVNALEDFVYAQTGGPV